MKIHWNGFLKHTVEQYPKEACAFLFSRRPYSPDEQWFAFPLKNVSSTPQREWIPDKGDISRMKKIAKEMHLVKIGNIHTHPLTSKDKIEEDLLPSDKDLAFARKFNDIIRGIIVVDNKAIYGIRFHDKFGNEIPITVVEVEEDNCEGCPEKPYWPDCDWNYPCPYSPNEAEG